MFKLLMVSILLAVFCSGCTSSDRYGKDGEITTVKRFMGIPYMKGKRTTSRGGDY